MPLKPSLLLLSNQKNEDPQEDLFLADFLKSEYQVTLAHPFEAEQYEDEVDIVLVRNIWPTMDYVEKFRAINARFIAKKFKVYNPPTGSGDMTGKEYLIDLWKAGYPVVPTVRNVGDIDSLPQAEKYVVKPLYGSNSIGVQIFRGSVITEEKIKGCTIQPFIQFKQEVSFYFIDGALQFALGTRDLNKRWKLVPFQYTSEQEQVAKRFVEWNTLPYGIQRIDFGLTENNEFLLMEIEDWCPYLSLLDIDSAVRIGFLDNLSKALSRLLVQKFISVSPES